MTQILLDASVSNQLPNRTHAVETPSSDAVQGEDCNAAAEVMLVWPDYDYLTRSIIRSAAEVEGELS